MSEATGPAEPSAEIARAEEVLDRFTERATVWASRLSREILKDVALAREEAEDIWAEAQTVAQGHRQSVP